jgi:hypothetical protein
VWILNFFRILVSRQLPAIVESELKAVANEVSKEITKFALFFRNRSFSDASAAQVFELLERCVVGCAIVANRLTTSAQCSNALAREALSLVRELVDAVVDVVDETLRFIDLPSSDSAAKFNQPLVGVVWKKCEALGALRLSNKEAARQILKSVLLLVKDSKDELENVINNNNNSKINADVDDDDIEADDDDDDGLDLFGDDDDDDETRLTDTEISIANDGMLNCLILFKR